MRSKGHILKTEWNGRRGPEAVTVGTCICRKWKKTGSSQTEVRGAYRTHLADVKRKAARSS